jgi:hypothetical protein
MEIVLKKSIETLTPSLIEFNNVELMQQAKAYLAKYENMIFDDNSIAEAKEVRAELNKISSELNKFRLGVQNVYEKPIKYFKNQIDEVKAEFDTVAKKIGETINDFTERQKAEKKAQITEIYLDTFGTLADVIKLERLYNSKWENKTYSLDNIKKEIVDWHDRIMQDIEAIYEMKDYDTIALKYIYYQSLNLSLAISEYKREEQSKALLKAREEEKIAKTIDWNAKVESGVLDEPTPLKTTIEEPKRTLSFKVELTNTQAKALKQFFIDNNIKYEKI